MKEHYSTNDNIELINQDQLSVSTSDLKSITIDNSSPKNINVKEIIKEEKSKTLAEICCEIIIALFMISILIIIAGYIGMGILFTIGHFSNDQTFFIKYNCISLLSPCFFIGAFSVIFCFSILSSIYFSCKSRMLY